MSETPNSKRLREVTIVIDDPQTGRAHVEIEEATESIPVSPPSPEEVQAFLALHLHQGLQVLTQLFVGSRLVLAVEGGEVSLGWFDWDGDEPLWHPIPAPTRHGGFSPVLTLLPEPDGFLAVSAQGLWRYRWAGANHVPDLVLHAALPLGARTLLSAANSPQHLAPLLTQQGPLRQFNKMQAMLATGDPLVRIETLLLLDASSFQELGSAAFQQTWVPGLDEAPGPKWSKVILYEDSLVLDLGGPNEMRMPLREGSMPDLQEALAFAPGIRQI